VLLLAFVLITLAQVVAAPSLSFGLHTFISTGLYLLTVVLVGASELDTERLTSIAKGIVVIALLVAAYAVLRHIIGPSAKERAIAAQQPFNFKDGKLLLFGSFESRHQLGLWCALVVPFCAGMAAVLHGRWRVAALAVIPLCAVALIASESRAALVAAIIGLAAVLALHSMGRAFPGPRLGVVLGAVIVLVGSAGSAIALSGGGGNETTKKFTVVLHPTSDAAYQARVAKWDEALREIRRQPMGHGLGTANQLQQQQGRFVSIGSFSIDNSYLRVGYEQGILPALIFVAGLLALTLALIRRAAITPDAARAGPALAAAGAMVAYVVVLYPSNAFDGYAALAAWLLAGVGIAPFLADARAESRSIERRSGSRGALRRSGAPMVPGLGSSR
jgi:O-antigen ligase